MRRRHVIALIGLVAFGLLALAACGESEPAAPSDVGARAVAMMSGPDGAAMGTVTLTQVPSGVLVSAEVHGLSAGGHGFHIHGVGACAPDFTAAGGHFDPDETGHGLMVNDTPHPGDLPNIYAGADGTARADVLTDAVTLDAGADHSLFDADGSAIIIHAKPDSYGEEPGAGDRVACGVIQRA